jgi:cytochrome c biogenesis protein CcmG, thiol:disulfide interchange protein DsbE
MQTAKRRANSRALLSLAAGLALIAASLVGFWWLGRNESSTTVAKGSLEGQPAPDFALDDLEGRTVRLSDLRGQVVLVNLWATWCPPCLAEMPDLAALYQTYKDQGLVILGVDDQERAQTVADFMARNPVPYPILLDPDSRVARAYGVSYLPASFLIDRRGVLRVTLPGQSARVRLENAIKPLLAEKP